MSIDRILCDWLDTTHPVDHPSYDEGSCDGFVSDITLFIASVGGEVVSKGDDRTKTRWKVGDDGGSFVVDLTPKFLRLSASGAVLAHLRVTETFLRYLSLLASVPHKITRIDVAGDRSDCSPPQAIASLRKKYPDSCSLGRKALITKSLLSADKDGRQTGTFYIGDRKTSKQTGRIYDKSHQMRVTRGVEIPPTLRYEFTTSSQHGATLNDAADPTPLFWKFGSQFLTKPKNAPEWVSIESPMWTQDAFEACPGLVLKNSVRTSHQLDKWLEIASKGGSGGIPYLRSLLNAALDDAETDAERGT